MSLATEPRPAQLPLPGGRSDATVRVHPILTGEVHAFPAFTDRPGGLFRHLKVFFEMVPPRRGWNWLPIPAFLIEHPTVGAILVDTGLHPSAASDVGGNMGHSARLLYRVRMEHEQALRFQLPRRGIAPEQITVVIMTHLHWDHASAVSEFPQATFVVDRAEWQAADEGGVLRGYYSRQFDHAFDWRTIDYDSREVNSFSGFAKSVDLFGDGSVRLVSTPGHTHGHQSVVLRTDSRELLIVGDAAYTMAGLHGETMPLILADEHVYRRSVKEIGVYLGQTPDAIAIPSHDFDLWPQLSPLYE